jgi:hypothetical protein
MGRRYPEVHAGHYIDPLTGELHFFEYGDVVLWSLTPAQEHYVLSALVDPALGGRPATRREFF